MVITKNSLQHIIDEMPDTMNIDEVFDRIKIHAKIDQALLESKQGLGQDWEEFKEEWLKQDLN